MTLGLALDGIPICQHIVNAVDIHLAENVGMTLYELLAVLVGNVVDIENTFFRFNLRMENNLHQNVAKLFTKHIGVFLIDSLDCLVGLLNKILLDAFVRLLNIPRAAALRAKDTHNLNEIVNIIFFFELKFVFHIHIILT